MFYLIADARRTGFALATLTVAVVAAGLVLGGCSWAGRIGALEQQIGPMNVALASKADVAAVAAEFVSVRGEAVAGLAAERKAREAAAAALGARIGTAEAALGRKAEGSAVEALAARLAGVEDRSAAQALGLATEQHEREAAVAALGTRISGAEKKSVAAQVQADTARKSTGRLLVDSARAQYAPDAEKVFEFWGFSPGLADFEKVLKSRLAAAAAADLKKFVEDGGGVIAAVGIEDSDPCNAEKFPLCKDDDLGSARAEAVVQFLGIEPSTVTIAGWHRRSGEFPTKTEARRVLIFVKKGAAPAAATPTPPAPVPAPKP